MTDEQMEFIDELRKTEGVMKHFTPQRIQGYLCIFVEKVNYGQLKRGMNGHQKVVDMIDSCICVRI